MRPLGIALVLLAVGFLLFSLWRRTRASAGGGPELPPLPKAPRGGGDHGVEGTYVATTLAGRHRDRVNARTLGRRGTALAVVRTDGVLLDRRMGEDLFIPMSALTGVRQTDSLVVLGWTHGAERLESAFRPDSSPQRSRLTERVAALIDQKGH